MLQVVKLGKSRKVSESEAYFPAHHTGTVSKMQGSKKTRTASRTVDSLLSKPLNKSRNLPNKTSAVPEMMQKETEHVIEHVQKEHLVSGAPCAPLNISTLQIRSYQL